MTTKMRLATTRFPVQVPEGCMEGDEIEATDEETKLVVKVRSLRFTMDY